MRHLLLFVVVAAGCGSGKHSVSDANTSADSTSEIDAAGCQPMVLLAGGTDIGLQGWATVMQSPASLMYGTDDVQLETSTASNATASGQLLLTRSSAVDPGTPFKFQVEMLVESVNPHNQFDSAAAIMASYTPPFGLGTERSQMIYLDAGKVGWADNTQSFTVPVTNNAFHIYELSVDANKVAHVTVDGVQALTRAGFVTNGVIAIGDQTNDPNIDSALRIRSVTKLCP